MQTFVGIMMGGGGGNGDGKDGGPVFQDLWATMTGGRQRPKLCKQRGNAPRLFNTTARPGLYSSVSDSGRLQREAGPSSTLSFSLLPWWFASAVRVVAPTRFEYGSPGHKPLQAAAPGARTQNCLLSLRRPAGR